ncbi:hypothetical protein HAX54_033834 [Datura stramonium]|uniref:Uncharacterized protein n=1 Tax=Datura stramonium TaxID=4076 RepID=A0ABS8VG01_DATST|nr:hypothetical protein [Datura stramonium]
MKMTKLRQTSVCSMRVYQVQTTVSHEMFGWEFPYHSWWKSTMLVRETKGSSFLMGRPFAEVVTSTMKRNRDKELPAHLLWWISETGFRAESENKTHRSDSVVFLFISGREVSFTRSGNFLGDSQPMTTAPVTESLLNGSESRSNLPFTKSSNWWMNWRITAVIPVWMESLYIHTHICYSETPSGPALPIPPASKSPGKVTENKAFVPFTKHGRPARELSMKRTRMI